MNEARKASFFPYIFFLFILLSAAYFAGGVFTFPDVSYTNFQNYLQYCLQHPFVNWWSDKTPVFLLLAFTIWLMMISYYLTNARRYMHGREHGTACWGDVREQCRKLEDKNGMNRILTQNFHMAPYVPYLNGNILILGGPGSGMCDSKILISIALIKHQIIPRNGIISRIYLHLKTSYYT